MKIAKIIIKAVFSDSEECEIKDIVPESVANKLLKGLANRKDNWVTTFSEWEDFEESKNIK